MAKLDTFEQWTRDGEVDAQLALIQSLSMQGFNLEEIAGEIGINERTLRRMSEKYPSVKSAIKNGRRHVVALFQNKLMERAQAGDTTAIIYGLKVYGGDFFNDRVRLNAELTGKNGSPIDVSMAPQIYLPAKDGDGDE